MKHQHWAKETACLVLVMLLLNVGCSPAPAELVTRPAPSPETPELTTRLDGMAALFVLPEKSPKVSTVYHAPFWRTWALR